MTPSNEMCPICSYAGSAQYCEWPSPEQIRQGVVPLDSLPAAWWNNMWADATNRINEARDMIGQVITEINNVLCNAGICAASACTDQLYQSINKIRQVLATDSIPGSVVSSNAGGAVCVANDGTMSVNCFGNVAALTTSAHTVVGAVNELKSTYDCCISDLQTCTSTLSSGKAPTSHASADTTYGVGNASNYGHVKLSDTYDSSIGAAADGIAASQKALYDMYTCITSAGYVTLGNTVGCALGTAAAGSCSTAARSDHVHPMLRCFQSFNDSWYIFAGWNTCSDNRFYLDGAAACTGGTRYGVHVSYADASGSAPKANCVCLDYYTGSADRPIMVSSASNTATACQLAAIGPVTSANKFTYNPATGQLKMTSCSKTVCISHQNCSYLHIYTDAGCIAFNKNIYLPAGCFIDRAYCARCIMNSAGTAAYCIYIS